MAGPGEQISIGRALAKLAIARAFRYTGTITHRGVVSPTLFMRILQDSDGFVRQPNGIVEEQRMLKIVIAADVQTGFPKSVNDLESVVAGDLITVSKYANRTYQVIDPINIDAGGRVYTLNCVEQKRLGAGVG